MLWQVSTDYFESGSWNLECGTKKRRKPNFIPNPFHRENPTKLICVYLH
jgi:hypothetical protein